MSKPIKEIIVDDDSCFAHNKCPICKVDIEVEAVFDADDMHYYGGCDKCRILLSIRPESWKVSFSQYDEEKEAGI